MLQPIISGVVAKNSDAQGCARFIQQSIDRVKNKQLGVHSFKRVLVLGASSGYGLSARIALTFSDNAADTIGVAWERPPKDDFTGSAGWHNSQAFAVEAEKQGRKAINIMADAFSEKTRQQVFDTIKREFGQVDCVIYSLATGVRPNNNGDMVRSSIAPVGESVEVDMLNLEHDSLIPTTLMPATQQQIDDTIFVMGGEDWLNWMKELKAQKLLAKGVQSFAFGYQGSELNRAIYQDGTLGLAKKDLHIKADTIHALLADIQGGAHVAVCKALVTKASVFIPGIGPYLMALYEAMKSQQLHEDTLDQMLRLFTEKVTDDQVHYDDTRAIRLDDWELRSDIQAKVKQILSSLTPENFSDVADYQGIKEDFFRLNGFGV